MTIAEIKALAAELGYSVTKTRKAEKISVTLAGENRYARVEMKNVASKMTSASLSPDGKWILFAANTQKKPNVPYNH